MITQYLGRMRIHKDKFELAKRMLLDGHTQREVARVAHLSLPQVSEVADWLGIYVDVEEKKKEVEGKMAELEKQEKDLEAEKLRKSAEIELYRRLGLETRKLEEAKLALENELSSVKVEIADARNTLEELKEEQRDLTPRIYWLRQERQKEQEKLDRIRKLQAITQKDAEDAFGKCFRYVMYTQTLEPAVDSGLDRMASVLSFHELDKLIGLMAKKNPGGYEAWLKNTRYHSQNESSPYLATDDKKQYGVGPTLEEAVGTFLGKTV